MRRSALFAVSLAGIIILTSCAGGVDEELLPTRVPTLDPQALVAAALAARPTQAPTATDTPQPPPPEPTPIVEETIEAQPEDQQAAEEPDSSTVIEYGGSTVSNTQEVTATEDLTPTVGLDAVEPVTGTQPITETAEISPTAEVDAAADVTATVDIEATPLPTETPTGPASETQTDAPVPSDAITESVTGAVTETIALTDTVESETVSEPTTTTETSAGLPTATATPEPAPTDEPQAVVDPVLAGLPESMLAQIADADPDNGELLVLSNACTGCHSLDPNQFMAGPTWNNIAQTAAGRVEGQSAALYIYNSILHPNDYVVEGFQPNIMLQIYQDTLTENDLADMIAYLLSIRSR